jgi:hypothetical protein
MADYTETANGQSSADATRGELEMREGARLIIEFFGNHIKLRQEFRSNRHKPEVEQFDSMPELLDAIIERVPHDEQTGQIGDGEESEESGPQVTVSAGEMSEGE